MQVAQRNFTDLGKKTEAAVAAGNCYLNTFEFLEASADDATMFAVTWPMYSVYSHARAT